MQLRNPRLLHKIRASSAVSGKILLGPKRILVRIISTCNLNCLYCWDHSSLAHKPYPYTYRVDLDTMKKIIDTAAEWGTEKLVLSGNGEPTLHPSFSSIVAYAQKKGLLLDLLTNGTFAPELLPAMAGMNRLFVNLGAPDSGAYERLQQPRTAGLFDRAIKNLKILSRVHKKYHKPKIDITFIVTGLSYPYIPEMLVLAKEIGVQAIFLKRFDSTKDTETLSLRAVDNERLVNILNKEKRKTWPFLHNLNSFKPLYGSEDVCNTKILSCLIGWIEMTIEADKRVGFCCYVTSDLYVGDLNECSLKEIWFGAKAQKLRAYCRSGINLKKYPRCRQCPYPIKNGSVMISAGNVLSA